MSLINDVLQELDRRGIGEGTRAYPNEVRPLPGAPKPRWNHRATLVCLLGIVGGVAIFYSRQTGIDATQAAREHNATLLANRTATTAQPPAAATETPPASSGGTDPVPMAPTSEREVAVPPAPTSTPGSAPAVATGPASPRGVVKDLPEGRDARTGPATDERTQLPETKGRRNLRLEPMLNSTPASHENPGAGDELTRAQTMIRLGRVDEAEPILRQLLQTQPRNVTARQALLGILLPAKRSADVAAQFREGLQHTPEQVGWAMSLARMQVEAKDPAAALDTLAFSRAYATDNPDYLAFSGTLLQRLGRSAEAVAAYDAALRIRPQEARWWVGFAIALEGAGRARDAIEAFSRARSLGGLSPDVQAYVEEKLR